MKQLVNNTCQQEYLKKSMNFARERKKLRLVSIYSSHVVQSTQWLQYIEHRQKQAGNKAFNCAITKRDNWRRASKLFKV